MHIELARMVRLFDIGTGFFHIPGLLILLGLPATVGWGAEAWLPPTETLLRGPGQLVLVTVERVGPGSEVHWQRLEVLHGAADERFSTPLRDVDARDLVPGRRFLLGVADSRRHPLFREGLAKDPAGWGIVWLAEVGEAVFPESPPLRRVLRWAEAGIPDAAAYLAQLQELLGDEWPSVRRFALSELVLRPPILKMADESIVTDLRAVLETANPAGPERQLILEIGRRLPGSLGSVWILEESRRALSDIPTELDLAGRLPGLVEVALEILTAMGNAADGELAERHLYSNHPGVVQRAAAAVEVLDCSRGWSAAVEVLNRSGSLHADSRRALQDLVERHCASSVLRSRPNGLR